MKSTKILTALTLGASLLATATPALANDSQTYTVKSGDTLSKIAEAEFGSADYVNAIAHVNDIQNVNLIEVNDVLELDKVQEAYDSGIKGITVSYSTGTNQNTVKQTNAATGAAQATAATTNTYAAPAYQAPATYSAPGGSVRLSNGNTAGAVGSQAAAEMAARTGVPASTWEHIIARESNGQVNAYNPSGASGLFQTMPFHGSTATVQDQINSAVNAYNAQGLAAWGF